ncbi:helix-turn-helix transcriptional regulator [Sphingomonas jatrophae]|uniref:DNA-binding transcriptional regulator, CsgD family n=1 Tax=Sphingomonas jatrophae TaxID=1166337 RepID=A0A1I6M1E0_9SPHN|nr:LuxR C-terminal-related transcriptional regulator [Sphingomonas jatrophae]SFS09483.1 DNA-binding transcriptional regulator, CsgD family [Sphingomonas jatrophae]
MLTVENIDRVRITDAASVRRAAEAFREIVEQLGDFRIAASRNIAVKEPMVDASGAILACDVFGWTDDENDRWWHTARLALDSPLTGACRYTSEPFWANATGVFSKQTNAFLHKIDLTNFEARALARAAIVVPVHLPFGQVGAVSFTSRDRSRDDLSAEFAALGDELGVYARTFVSTYVPVMCKAERLPAGSRLSKREVECLRWAAIGKTDHEISTIIERSRATVRFHIHNASIKLDAVNRSQTVFKAAQLGYIGLNS